MRDWLWALAFVIGVTASLTDGCVSDSKSSSPGHTAAAPANPIQSANATTTAASRATGSAACLSIIDGAPTVAYPQVWAIGNASEICTGTFVSDNALVTASHCIPCDGSPLTLLSNQGVFNSSLLGGTDNATSSRYVSAYPAGCDGNVTNFEGVNQDVAIVIFPDHTAATSAQVAISDVAIGTLVSFVGYGFMYSFAGTGENPTLSYKNIGTNTLAAIPAAEAVTTHPVDVYTVIGSGTANGSASGGSSIGEGDSGGPLFAAPNVIIGSTSSVIDIATNANNLSSTQHYAFFPSLVGPVAKTLFTQAVASGARINYATPPPAPMPAPAPCP